MLSKKAREKIKNFFEMIIFFVVILLCLAIGNGLDSSSNVQEIKTSIVMMSSEGMSLEDISSSYKFQEYPGKQVFESLQESGELNELIRYGRSKWSSILNPLLQVRLGVFPLFQFLLYFFSIPDIIFCDILKI